MKRMLVCAAALVCLSSLQAQEQIASPKTGKLVVDSWLTASFDGVRSGYTHLSVYEMEGSNGQKIFRASREMSLTLKRFGDIAPIQAVTGSDEAADGRVLGVFMRQGLGRNIDLLVRGVVKQSGNGWILQTKGEGKMQFEKEIPWDPTVVGTWGELQHIARKRPAPGTNFQYTIYEAIINSMVKVNAVAETIEQVEIAGKTHRLLKIVAVPEKIKTSSQPGRVEEVQLPGSTFWFDYNYEMVKSETIMPGLGKLVLERSTQQEATRPCVGPDLGLRQSIKLNQALRSPQDSELVIYKIKLKDDKPTEVFATDDRQTIRATPDGGLEIRVQAIRQPPTQPTNSASPGAEFIEPNNFINSDDALVRQHAATAAGTESDSWKKSLLIERWVHDNMKAMDFTEAMAPAAEVARTLRGDCTEYSMLAAAMCRAVGIPSRTALGLVYVDPREGRPPMLAMHMWTEVWVNGKWVAIDATIGRGSIGADHLKITDHSWHKTSTMNPLMPLMRVIMSGPLVEITQEQKSRP